MSPAAEPRALAARLDVPFALIDEEGRVDFANEAFAALLGQEPAKLAGARAGALVSGLAGPLSAARAGGLGELEAHGFIADLTDDRRLAATLFPLTVDKRPFAALVCAPLPPEPERPPRATTGIIGRSPAMQRVLALVRSVAPTPSTVLLHGESGVGKELVAREIHAASARRDRPFVKVNCAAIPNDLFESEFFGHVRGAFTGAVRDRVGRFEAAHGGTLFLDEVGELPLPAQAKLLRVLQEGEIERIGEERIRRVDVRVIAATNRRLVHEVRERRFRKDLYFRLSVFPLEVPPLRDHTEDVELLASHYLDVFSAQLGRHGLRLEREDLARLERYPWPACASSPTSSNEP